MGKKKFNVVFTDEFRKKFEELPQEDKQELEALIAQIAEDPMKGTLITKGKYKGCRYVDSPQGAS